MSDHDRLRLAIHWVRNNTGLREINMTAVDFLDALAAAAESTLPRTKMVLVWHCAWATRSPGGDFVHVNAYRTEGAARDHAEFLESGGNNSGVEMFGIRVTGPHQQEVPV